MDEKSIRQRLEGLTYRQLQLEAKENQVKANGKKGVLIENLIKKLLKSDASSLGATHAVSEKEEKIPQKKAVKDGARGTRLSADKEDGASQKEHVEDSAQTALLAVDEEKVETPQMDVVEDGASQNNHAEDGAHTDQLSGDEEKEESRENFSPIKAKLPSSPMKSPGAVRHLFNAIHQHAAEQLPDIEIDQQCKEERKECLTKSWIPRLKQKKEAPQMDVVEDGLSCKEEEPVKKPTPAKLPSKVVAKKAETSSSEEEIPPKAVAKKAESSDESSEEEEPVKKPTPAKLPSKVVAKKAESSDESSEDETRSGEDSPFDLSNDSTDMMNDNAYGKGYELRQFVIKSKKNEV